MNKKYTDYSSSEKLALTPDELEKSVKLEAIHRGVAVPITLDAKLKQIEAKGFNMPAEYSEFFMLMAQSASYNSPEATGIAFKSLEQAKAALNGSYLVYQDGFDHKRCWKLGPTDGFSIQQVCVVDRWQQSYWTKLQELSEDTQRFDDLCEECRLDLEKVRQDDYNVRVNQVARQQYIDLADGNEEIARAFWIKTKGSPFPEKLS